MKFTVDNYKKKVHQLFIAITLTVFLSSCYSVRVVNRDGVPEPDPLNTSGDFYKGKKVHIVDTVISLKPQEGEFSLIEKCSSEGFYSFEYRTTFGGVLLNAVTFGRKRQVKIKYVCLKQSD
jgi:hypothetical protein